eukprot:TRINITY_DN9268_c0_g1_i1.p1 TRINITY_DN9268_c0_g1~~TRINITY_DN9268_c0_g1_i1.p1  ORF type:complete len:266 (-),score=105.39 TRINITY_DN9268_c0_g1_i1:325-1122(-)
MPAHQLPEIMRVPLEQLCLQILSMDLGSPKEFLGKALQPPEKSSIQAAMDTLSGIQAVNNDGLITPLGSHLAQLPVDVRCGKMILYGVMFGCVEPICVIAAQLSVKSPFLAPLEKRKEANKAKLEFTDADERSDHLTFYRAYRAWLDAERDGSGYQFCRDSFLSRNTMLTIADLQEQFLEVLMDSNFISSSAVKEFRQIGTRRKNNRRGGKGKGNSSSSSSSSSRNEDDEMFQLRANEDNPNVIKAVLAAGLYPNVVKVELPKTK